MDFFWPAANFIVTHTTLFNRPFIPKNGFVRGESGVAGLRLYNVPPPSVLLLYYQYYYLLLHPCRTGRETFMPSYFMNMLHIGMLGIRFENPLKNKCLFHHQNGVRICASRRPVPFVQSLFRLLLQVLSSSFNFYIMCVKLIVM